ncbi:MAG: AbrB/MazE/SpoVT family DNA-binding domain-containing protein [Candidatus Jordarchaeum sp.]|uniref:AbrB/MazE/SpoVT family DNA-binding domain-containing protein n=1 Tax=Candidatus Jordarchaeum sp. TaxID=2823881 RepID=UPI0040497609
MAVVIKKLRISKGYQVAVPSETRERHGLEPGDEIVWIDTGEEIFIRPLKKNARLTDLIGKYDTEKGFDSALEHDEVASGEH